MEIDENGNKVTLKELISIKIKHLEDRIKILETTIEYKIFSLQKATDLVADNMKEKFAQQNEWRGQSKDRELMYITREEVNSKIENICNDIGDLKKSKAYLEGKASQAQVNIGIGISVLAIIISLIKLFII